MDRRVSASAAERKTIDAEILSTFERRMGVMITDMSGMTELTKKRGILDILTLVRQMQLLADPILAAHGATLVKTEADDLFVVHESAKQLYSVAQALLAAAAKRNADQPDADPLYICVGLAFGPVLFLGDEIWGDAVNVASKLGEDTAAGGEILVDEGFHAQLVAEGGAPQCSLIPPSHRKTAFAYYSCR